MGEELGTAGGVDSCDGIEISWIIYLFRLSGSSRRCSEGSEIKTEDVVR